MDESLKHLKGETIRPFQFTAQCNACGATFSRPVDDTNLGDAERNFMTSLTLGHGSGYGKFGTLLYVHKTADKT